MPRFFLPRKAIHDGKGIVTGQELEHLRRVLRLRPGDRITAFDDEGWEHEGIIRSFTDQSAEVEISKSTRPARESPLEICLAQALGKGDKMDFIVEKATELGARSIIPFLSAYTVPRPDGDKAERRLARWKKIALSAAKQSGRTQIPEIPGLTDFGELVRRSWPPGLKLLFWERESRIGLNRMRDEIQRLDFLLLTIGPEGGFSPDEAAEAARHEFRSVSLGRRTLRSETAALAALSIAQFLWGDIG